MKKQEVVIFKSTSFFAGIEIHLKLQGTKRVFLEGYPKSQAYEFFIYDVLNQHLEICSCN
tara:strand:- start:4744 stop:4923 length:180 start_codon:yes stop_codon:yes gene_type:complete